MSSEDVKGNLIVISAPSGAGKTSLARRIIQDIDGVSFSVSHTTRTPREGEREGVDYFFVSEHEFRRMIDQGEFLEHAQVFERQFYGTGKAFVSRMLSQGRDVLLDVDVQGGLQVKSRMPEAITVFVFPPSLQVLEARLRRRGLNSDEQIAERLRAAAREIGHHDRYDYILVNDDFENSLLGLKSIVLAARCRRSTNLETAQAICRSFQAVGREP